ncbi:hypothetical protein EUX98_g7321 [Antrodiella citrinella]|uniref:Uncharacterized protein n=1 Tax=Antrodiella citrinella TaxID=2447956 RepID=A0A4S4MLV7_9APHY|nr:hypothetical protein EUX98_g7321 [Antrodiella citrinella]
MSPSTAESASTLSDYDAVVALIANALDPEDNTVAVGTTSRTISPSSSPNPDDSSASRPTSRRNIVISRNLAEKSGHEKTLFVNTEPLEPPEGGFRGFEDYVITVIRHSAQSGAEADRSTLETFVTNGPNAMFAHWEPSGNHISFQFKPHIGFVRLFKSYADRISSPAFVMTNPAAGTFQVQGAGLTVFRDVIERALHEICRKVQLLQDQVPRITTDTAAGAIIRFHFLLGYIPKEFWQDESLVTALAVQK